MKPREFWIKQCDYIPNRAVDSLEAAKCTAGCDHNPIHVREILPEDEIWLKEIRSFDEILNQNKKLAIRVFELEKQLRDKK